MIIDNPVDEQTHPQQINGVAMSSAHVANNLSELIGDTDLVRINSLSEISGCEILLKCEHKTRVVRLKIEQHFSLLWML